jgi:hypothetical protein
MDRGLLNVTVLSVSIGIYPLRLKQTQVLESFYDGNACSSHEDYVETHPFGFVWA